MMTIVCENGQEVSVIPPALTKISITPEEVEWAKEETTKFDAIKTYNKLECKNNWIGVLGELKFDQWLTNNGISHVWHQFCKKDWDEPDFEICDHTVDVKTSFDTKMWLQDLKCEHYVFCRLNKDDVSTFFIVGFISKPEVYALIKNGETEIVKREGRNDLTVKVEHLGGVQKFLESLLSQTPTKVEVLAEKKMENQEGKSREALPTWDNVETLKPKMKWEIGQTQEVIFKCDKPQEIMWADQVKGDQRLFLFEVTCEGQERVIMTGARSLVQGIKALTPLNGKVALITKNSKNGKQFYEVHEADVA